MVPFSSLELEDTKENDFWPTSPPYSRQTNWLPKCPKASLFPRVGSHRVSAAAASYSLLPISHGEELELSEVMCSGKASQWQIFVQTDPVFCHS